MKTAALRVALRRVPRFEAQLSVALIVLYASFTIANPSVFPTVATLQNLGRQGGVLLAVAIGQMAVLIVGGFDISVGANMGFCSTVLALTIGKVGLPAAIAIGIAASGLAGLVNGVLVAYFRINPFITTLATATFLTGLSNQLTGGNSQLITDQGILWLGGNNWGPFRRRSASPRSPSSSPTSSSTGRAAACTSTRSAAVARRRSCRVSQCPCTRWRHTVSAASSQVSAG